jgi:hypothetical protein
MAQSPGQYIALGKQQSLVQGRRRPFASMKDQIDIALLRLAQNLRGVQLEQRQPGAGCGGRRLLSAGSTTADSV